MDLGAVLGMRGGRLLASGLLSKALEAQKRVAGAEHPDALRTAGNLAHALAPLGENAAAAAVRREVLEVRGRVLRAEHTDARWLRGIVLSEKSQS